MLDDYLKGIFKTAKQADATEPSYYPALKDLLEAFAAESGHSKVQVTTISKTIEIQGEIDQFYPEVEKDTISIQVASE